MKSHKIHSHGISEILGTCKAADIERSIILELKPKKIPRFNHDNCTHDQTPITDNHIMRLLIMSEGPHTYIGINLRSTEPTLVNLYQNQKVMETVIFQQVPTLAANATTQQAVDHQILTEHAHEKTTRALEIIDSILATFFTFFNESKTLGN